MSDLKTKSCMNISTQWELCVAFKTWHLQVDKNLQQIYTQMIQLIYQNFLCNLEF